MSEDNKILDFWENMDSYKTPDVLKDKAREYYTNEFINDFEKWSANVTGLNDLMKDHMSAQSFPMAHWNDMSYDWFCRSMNKMIEDWISENSAIYPYDMPIITEKLIADYIAHILNKYYESAFSMSSLMESIKSAVIM